MLIGNCFAADGEYRQLRDELSRSIGGRALPFAACGLCDGAADALMTALLDEFRGRGAALCILPEEKDCNRLCALFSQYGLRAAFFTGRDLTFYNKIGRASCRERVLW